MDKGPMGMVGSADGWVGQVERWPMLEGGRGGQVRPRSRRRNKLSKNSGQLQKVPHASSAQYYTLPNQPLQVLGDWRLPRKSRGPGHTLVPKLNRACLGTMVRSPGPQLSTAMGPVLWELMLLAAQTAIAGH